MTTQAKTATVSFGPLQAEQSWSSVALSRGHSASEAADRAVTNKERILFHVELFPSFVLCWLGSSSSLFCSLLSHLPRSSSNSTIVVKPSWSSISAT